MFKTLIYRRILRLNWVFQAGGSAFVIHNDQRMPSRMLEDWESWEVDCWLELFHQLFNFSTAQLDKLRCWWVDGLIYLWAYSLMRFIRLWIFHLYCPWSIVYCPFSRQYLQPYRTMKTLPLITILLLQIQHGLCFPCIWCRPSNFIPPGDNLVGFWW